MNWKATFDIVQTSRKLDRINSGGEKDRVNSVANDSSFGPSNDQLSSLNPPALQFKVDSNPIELEGDSELEISVDPHQFVAAAAPLPIHNINVAGPFQLKAVNKTQEKENAESIPETQPFQLTANAEGTPSEDATSGAADTPSNNTGLPTQLKSGVENLSGYSLDDVKVHYNSDKPAQLQAHAYAQGTDIHLGAGQEKHLPHEAWHVVQQKQGRVQATTQMKGVGVNDDSGLEKEADEMGAKALNFNLDNNSTNLIPIQPKNDSNKNPIQRFPTDEQWISKSDLKKGFKNKKTRDRSAPLQQVDQKVFAYNKLVWVNNKDYEGRKQLLIDIENIIILWKNSKGDRPLEGHKPSEDKKRWPALSKLRVEATTESQLVQQLINDVAQQEKERLEQARDDLIASIFAEEIRGIEDKGARADRLFTDYMAHFKGKADYTLKTVAGNNIYTGGAKIACATISAGLRDAFRFFGLTSSVEQIPAKYFITKKIGASFMDSNAVGNVKRPNGDYSDEKRFFFTGHWIVKVNGNKYFDPTSGIPVGADGAEIIDPKYTDLKSKAPNYEKGDTIKLTTLIDGAPSGSGYLLEET